MDQGVDVVIPTFRRPEALARCLAALEVQTVAPTSIQVVDDSKTDKGPAYTRNLGWRKGNAPIVAFTDDDCVPSANWVNSIQRRFEANSIGGVEGSVTIVGEDGSLSDMDPHPKDRWNRFKTANMAYRRNVLEAVNGFDERYFIHREDTDLAWRVINSGHSIEWAPECLVHHPDRTGMRRLMVRSELLLYRCDKSKFIEVAAAMISIENLRNGTLRGMRRGMRKHRDDVVRPLSRGESASLWTKAFLRSLARKFSSG
jgi:GT2 family glycosyltransferase